MNLNRILLVIICFCLISFNFVTVARDETKPAIKNPEKVEEKVGEQKPQQEPTKVKFVEINVSGEMNEKMELYDFIYSSSITMNEFKERLEKAAKDNEVKGICLNIGSPRIGFGKLQQIRRMISDFRRSNKRVYAFLNGESTVGYLIATACDEIIMVPSGWLFLCGLGTEVYFFKDLLDWAGVEANIIQMGKYKSAGEPFTNREMSPAMKEELDSLLDDLFQQLVEMIAVSRNIEMAEVKNLINKGPFTADEALEYGLVDRLIYKDKFNKEFLKNEKVFVEFDEDYGEEKVDTSQMSLFNFFSLFSKPTPTEVPSMKPAIALVTEVGVIVAGSEDDYPFSDEIIASGNMLKIFDEIMKNKRIKAIVLKINSPGGSAVASDIIWNKIREVKKVKPVVVSMSDVAASGGYYIAAGADKIVAQEGTITGSIGVIGGKFVLKGLYDKILINKQILTRGENAAILSDYSAFSDSEKAVIEKMIKKVYDDFVNKVAISRNMSVEAVDKIAQGRVWTGKQAFDNRLVDMIGGVDEAISEAKKLGKISEDTECDIILYPKQLSFFDFLSKFMGGSVESSAFESVAFREFGLLYNKSLLVKLMNKELVVTMMPFQIEVK